MKRLLIIAITFSLLISDVIAQNWQWSTAFGGLTTDHGGKICNDNNGNIYMTGIAGAPVIHFPGSTFGVSGYNDIFVAKFNQSGIFQWANVFGGNYQDPWNFPNESGRAVEYCPSTNSVYVCGTFLSTMTVGSYTLTSQGVLGSHDVFLARFDLNGNCIWAKRIGSNGDDQSYDLSINDDGKVYIVGTFEKTAVLDSITLSKGGFLASYDQNGNCRWAKIVYSPANNISGAAGTGFSIKIFEDDLFILGSKHADTLMVDTISFISQNFYPLILSRFDSIGNVKWATAVGGPTAFGGSLSLDTVGNCYFGGYFYTGGYAVFGPDTIFATSSTDLFLTKYNSSGNYIWVRQANTTSGGRVNSCSSDANGNIYITGRFQGTANFGNYNVSSGNSQHMFLARYDKNGICIGVTHKGHNYELGTSLITNGDGSVVVSGLFGDSCTFDSLTYTSIGSTDLFLAKFDAITGLNPLELSSTETVLLFPNPTSGICNLILPQSINPNADITIEIIDTSGKILIKSNLQATENQLSFNLQSLSNGLYFIRVYDTLNYYSSKLILQK